MGFTGQRHHLVGLNHQGCRGLHEGQAAMQSYEKQKEQRPSAPFLSRGCGVPESNMRGEVMREPAWLQGQGLCEIRPAVPGLRAPRPPG